MADLKKEISQLKDSLTENMGADSVKAAIDRAMRQMGDDGMQSLAGCRTIDGTFRT